MMKSWNGQKGSALGIPDHTFLRGFTWGSLSFNRSNTIWKSSNLLRVRGLSKPPHRPGKSGIEIALAATNNPLKSSMLMRNSSVRPSCDYMLSNMRFSKQSIDLSSWSASYSHMRDSSAGTSMTTWSDSLLKMSRTSLLGYLSKSGFDVTRSSRLHWLGMPCKKGSTRKIPIRKTRERTEDALKMSKYSIRAQRRIYSIR